MASYNPDYGLQYFGCANGDLGDELDDEVGLGPLIESGPPARAGAFVGALAGPIAFLVVHACAATALTQRIVTVSHLRGVNVAFSFMLAYATSAALGWLAGSTFAVITRYLRRWLPLLFWSVTFFLSLAVLLLATAIHYGRDVGSSLTMAVLIGAAVFAGLITFSLPIQHRH